MLKDPAAQRRTRHGIDVPVWYRKEQAIDTGLGSLGRLHFSSFAYVNAYAIAYIHPKATSLSHQPFPEPAWRFWKGHDLHASSLLHPPLTRRAEGEPFESMPLGFIHKDRLKLQKC